MFEKKIQTGIPVPDFSCFQEPINLQNVSSPKKNVSSPNLKGSPEKKLKTEITPPSLLVESPISKMGRFIRDNTRNAPKISFSFFDEIHKITYGTDLNSLSNIYEINFNIPTNENLNHFFEIPTLLVEIEKIFQTNGFLILEEARQKLSSIFTSKLSHEEKMAELGVFLFLLNRDQKIPPLNIPSYLVFRAEEICEEAERLIKQNEGTEKYDKHHLIPSGKIHYFLRTFAKMILSEKMKFNAGASYALKQLLLDTKFGIASYLKPEHHMHILCVIQQLINKPSFKTLLEKPIKVHPDLANRICVDWKIPQSNEVPSNLVMWDCLMAFLFDIRQKDDPNCYAIAVLQYAIENNAYKTLKFLIKCLENGHFEFNEKLTIPIFPLVEKRLIDERDLNEVKIPSQEALQSPTVQHLTSSLNLSSPTFENKKRSLNQTFTDILDKNEAKDKLPLAQEMFSYYKENSLIQILVAIIEFYSTNSYREIPTTSTFSDKKNEFLNVLFNVLPHNASKSYVNLFKQKISEKIWLENHSEKHLLIKKKKIEVGPSHNKKIIPFKGDFKGNLPSLSTALSQSVRICILQDKKYELIETISALQTKLIEIAQSVGKEIKNSKKTISSRITKKIQDKSFRKEVSNYCASKLRDSGIKGEHLEESDLLISKQQGEEGHHFLDRVLGLKYEKFSLKTKDNEPSTLLYTLLSHVQSLEPKMIEKTSVCYVRTDQHAFTLSPQNFHYFPKKEEKISKWIKKEIDIPVQEIDKTKISEDTTKSIIEEFTGKKAKLKSKIHEYFKNNKNLNYEEFRSHFLKEFAISKTSKQLFYTIFDKEIMKKKLNKNELVSLLQIFNIKTDKVDDLMEDIRKSLPKPTEPIYMAHALRRILIEKKIGIFSLIDIERALCEVFHLPKPVDLGDLNWCEASATRIQLREDPYHVRLAVRWDFGTQSLCYFERFENEEIKVEEDELYTNFSLIYPNY